MQSMASTEPETMETEAIAENTNNHSSGPGVDLTEKQDGGVLKEILREGEGEDRPSKGDKVKVHYVGTLLDGTPFDSSRERGEHFTFNLGKGQVIKAWDLGIASMRKGELAKFTCRADYAYGESGSPPKIPPNATLVFEVELFSWEIPCDDLSPNKDKGILRYVLHASDTYKTTTPADFASVTIKYSAKIDQQVIIEDTTTTFTLGEVEDPKIVIGLETAIKKMKSQERSRIVLSPFYAFGKDGNQELNVPPNATVTYEVELISFEKAKKVYEMETPEKLEQAEIRKAKGTEFFKKGLTEKAVTNYATILEYLDSETSLEGGEKDKRDALVLAAHLNLAACELRLGNDAKVIEHCNGALELNKDNSKAYFRRAQAHQNRKDYDEAVKDYNQVVALEPDNKAAKNQIIVCKKKLQEEHQQEKKLYANMFSKMTQQTAKVGEK
ncbi:peptidyl-prolyl cis-trans isomerase FKBP4-like isoform X2 [Physella acuta]|uniref:peptidyl-prolyl cis-trans isomerase FKBP4-like isoform X2 n=1 Tax=Physella acuta TaxID=109671 RepID=UPI0027DBD9AF|nr:peptidyl-prolyl cis-trans isomerase FKBP4-like isoform X2 [Physella acuta]